jgi:hypothetical protein
MDTQEASEWRAEKAEMYPADLRNQQSSLALAKLAEQLAQTTPDHPCIQTLLLFWKDVRKDSGRTIDWVAAQARYIGRYGFDIVQDGDPQCFLDGLLQEFRRVVDADHPALVENYRPQPAPSEHEDVPNSEREGVSRAELGAAGETRGDVR